MRTLSRSVYGENMCSKKSDGITTDANEWGQRLNAFAAPERENGGPASYLLKHIYDYVFAFVRRVRKAFVPEC